MSLVSPRMLIHNTCGCLCSNIQFILSHEFILDAARFIAFTAACYDRHHSEALSVHLCTGKDEFLPVQGIKPRRPFGARALYL